MSPLEPMTREERSLYNLERTLIHRHFPGLSARQVRLVEAPDFDGRAAEPRLELAQAAAEQQDAAALLTHILIHYELKDGGHPHWYGHGPLFARRAAELGVYSEAVRRRCFSMGDWLENPFLRSGPHAVHARVIDVVFALAGAYEEELRDFFLNERWLRGGHRLPESLLPFVKFYADELTDLLAVRMSVVQLTPGRC